MKLPDSLRDQFKTPLGLLLPIGEDNKENIQKYLSKNSYVITVGDQTTEKMINFGLIPSLQIIDGFEKRQKRDLPKLGSATELKIDNYTNSFGTGEQKYTIFCSTHWSGGTSPDTLFAIGRTDTNRNVSFHPNSNGSFNHYHFSADVTGTGISDETSLTLGLRYFETHPQEYRLFHPYLLQLCPVQVYQCLKSYK